jgi:hypothetical protein
VRNFSEYQWGISASVITQNGDVVLGTQLDIYGDALHFDSPATDSTANVFLTYNPRRYNGVLVLVPTNDGFKDPGWSDTKYGSHYDGKRAYYADLQGPDADGRYTIIKSRNDCHPDCAGGTITGQTLHWNGSDYTP